MRRLHFGGSFNPIHHGHLICARAALETSEFDQIVLVPTAQPPHKAASATLASAADRLAMAQAAVAGDPLFEVDELELRRTGPSYTLDTVRALKAGGSQQVHWLIGADMLLYLPHWHQALQLMREVRFVIMARPGWVLDWEQLPAEFRHLRSNVVETPLISISATEIRARVSAGLPIDYLCPRPVCEYIESRKLYRQ